MIPTLFAISVVTFVIIQLPPGDYLTDADRGLGGAGRRGRSGHPRRAARPLRPRPADLRAVLQLDHGHPPARRLRHLVRVEAAGHGADLGPARLHVPALVLARCCSSGRSRSRSASTRRCGNTRSATTSSTFLGFHRPRGAELPARARPDVRRLRGISGRASAGSVLAGMPTNALGPGRSSSTSSRISGSRCIVLGTAGTAALIRIMRANLLDELNKPYVDHRPRQGPLRMPADPEVSGPRRAQPVRLDARLGAAGPGLRRRHRLRRAEPADLGPAAAALADEQDMYLAGCFILMLSALTVIGTLISDILLAGSIRASATSERAERPSPRPRRAGRRRRRAAASSRTKVQVAGQWRLIWWNFRRHGWRSPAASSCCADLSRRALRRVPRAVPLRYRELGRYTYAPPQRLHFFHARRADGWRFAPHVNGLRVEDRPASPCAAPSCSIPSKADPGRLLRPGASPTGSGALIPLRPAPDRARSTRRSRCICSAPTGSAATSSAAIIHGTRVSHVDRPRRRAAQPRPRHRARRHLRLFRRRASTRSSSASSSSCARCRPSRSGWAWPRRSRSTWPPLARLFRHHRSSCR